MTQLTLSLDRLPAATLREAAARGLAVDETIAARDQRLVGVVSGAMAGLNHALEEAAEAGFDVHLIVDHQDLPGQPRRRVLRGRITRLAVDARI